MKLGYECLIQRVSFSELFKNAINKTLEEQMTLAIANLKKYTQPEDGAPEYLSVNF